MSVFSASLEYHGRCAAVFPTDSGRTLFELLSSSAVVLVSIVTCVCVRFTFLIDFQRVLLILRMDS